METKFSIVVPVYNGETIIERCIQSVLRQEFEEWELILVNDGSTDGTKEICERYLWDSRVHLIDQKNKGVSCSRNAGIDAAQGEYVLFLDADDHLERNACTVFAKLMDDNQCDFCIAGYNRVFSSRKPKTVELSLPFEESVYLVDNFGKVFSELYKNNFLNSPWAKCYKRNLISSYFDKDLSLGEDFIFNLNYMSNCKTIYVSQISLYNYEIQESGSLSSGLSKKGFEMLNRVYEKSLLLTDRLFGEDPKVKNAIDTKFVVDLLVLFERSVRFSNRNFGKSGVKMNYEKYSLEQVFHNVVVDEYGRKYELERRILCRHFYGIFCKITLLLFKINKIFGK